MADSDPIETARSRLMGHRDHSEGTGSTGESPVDGGGLEGRAMLSLSELSFPPTEDEMERYGPDVAIDALPYKYKRPMDQRVFVNRDVHMQDIEYIGFDMDYTLAEYISPAFEELSYRLLAERLVAKGYPEQIADRSYDSSFPIRGLFLDREAGNLLKIDAFGSIITAVHGRRVLDSAEMEAAYPSSFVSKEAMVAGHFYILDTLFGMPEACLYADLVDFFEDPSNAELVGDIDMSFQNLFTDVRSAMEYVHNNDVLKKETLLDLPRYIHSTKEIGPLLLNLRSHGKKVFILTNSGYAYTNAVMDYLLSPFYDQLQDEAEQNWRFFFDICIVAARKPTWFQEGSILREIDVATGNLSISKVHSFRRGAVYEGGSIAHFQDLLGIRGPEVLYCGDHVFGDVVKAAGSKWRTLLVVPELDQELASWAACYSDFTHLQNLYFILAEALRDLDASAEEVNLDFLRRMIDKTEEKISRSSNTTFGSTFRSNAKRSFFAMQVERYADLYAASFRNLSFYPIFYYFNSEVSPLPHERAALRGQSGSTGGVGTPGPGAPEFPI